MILEVGVNGEKKRRKKKAERINERRREIPRCRLVTSRGIMIVGNLDTQFPSVGPNPPISLREREGAERRRKEALWLETVQ